MPFRRVPAQKSPDYYYYYYYYMAIGLLAQKCHRQDLPSCRITSHHIARCGGRAETGVASSSVRNCNKRGGVRGEAGAASSLMSDCNKWVKWVE